MSTQTPLHRAAAEGRVEVCRRLLQDGAQVDAIDGHDCTPLAAAMLTYDLIRIGGVSFSTEPAEREVIERLAQTVWLLRDHGASFELIHQSIHGPFPPEVEAWAHHIDARRKSANQQRALEQDTAPAIGNRQAGRL